MLSVAGSQLGVRLKFLLDFAAWLWRQGLALWGLPQPSYKGSYLQPPVLPHAPPNSPTLKLNERLEAQKTHLERLRARRPDWEGAKVWLAAALWW